METIKCSAIKCNNNSLPEAGKIQVYMKGLTMYRLDSLPNQYKRLEDQGGHPWDVVVSYFCGVHLNVLKKGKAVNANDGFFQVVQALKATKAEQLTLPTQAEQADLTDGMVHVQSVVHGLDAAIIYAKTNKIITKLIKNKDGDYVFDHMIPAASEQTFEPIPVEEQKKVINKYMERVNMTYIKCGKCTKEYHQTTKNYKAEVFHATMDLVKECAGIKVEPQKPTQGGGNAMPNNIEFGTNGEIEFKKDELKAAGLAHKIIKIGTAKNKDGTDGDRFIIWKN